MLPKPVQLTSENANRFTDQSVVSVYHLRLPYPPDVLTKLLSLIVDLPRNVLDVGTGTGELARALAPHVFRVDAVDISALMIEKGKQEPGGNHPNLHWLLGAAETVELAPPYTLIVGGDSVHWMDWPKLFNRFHEILSPHGYVALIERWESSVAWGSALQALVKHFSLMQNYEPYDLVEELTKRSHFNLVGEIITPPVTYRQSIENYIQSFHSRASLSTQAMLPEAAAEFDTSLRELVTPYSQDGMLTLQTIAQIRWGNPLRQTTAEL